MSLRQPARLTRSPFPRSRSLWLSASTFALEIPTRRAVIAAGLLRSGSRSYTLTARPPSPPEACPDGSARTGPVATSAASHSVRLLHLVRWPCVVWSMASRDTTWFGRKRGRKSSRRSAMNACEAPVTRSIWVTGQALGPEEQKLPLSEERGSRQCQPPVSGRAGGVAPGGPAGQPPRVRPQPTRMWLRRPSPWCPSLRALQDRACWRRLCFLL